MVQGVSAPDLSPLCQGIIKTGLCIIHCFAAVKNDKFLLKKLFFLFLLKIYNINKATLTCSHNLCFRAKIRKKCIPMYTPVLLYEPRHEKTVFLHMRKQSRRSAVR